MCFSFTTLADSNIDRVMENPPLIWRVIARDEPEFYLEAIGANKKPGFLSRVFGITAPPKEDFEIPGLDFTEGEGVEGDLDKSWHGIHYLLTKSAWGGDPPLNFIIAGGQEVGQIDVGYGTARVFRASEVQEIASALEDLDNAELERRYDPEDMSRKDIYPEIWERDSKDSLEYCLDNFNNLKTFIKAASENRLGLVVYVC